MMVPPQRRAGGRGRRRLAGLLALSVLACLILAAPGFAADNLGISSFTTSASTTQAGAHPDVTTSIVLDLPTFTPPGFPFAIPDGTKGLDNLVLDLPPGLMGNIAKIPTCSIVAFRNSSGGGGNVCPDSAQVGYVDNLMTELFPGFDLPLPDSPIWNIEPGPGQPARLGFNITGLPVTIAIGVRTGSDYGLSTITSNIPVPNAPMKQMRITLWGDPADHVAGGMDVPFMTNPTDCTQTPVTTLRVSGYNAPNTYASAESASPQPTGCDQLQFTPGLKVLPDNPVADQPSGLSVDLTIPDNPDPHGLSQPALKNVVVNLPDGVTINPPLAHDITACTDGAFALNSSNASTCPAGSKIGKIGIDLPALPNPLPGDIYLGTPQPGNPFRLFLYADGSGVKVKLEGSVIPDPKTGRISTVFNGNPQVPFRRFHLEFQGGGNAALLMPQTCGTKTAQAGEIPWSTDQATIAGASFQINGDLQGHPCADPMPFGPTFQAGVTNANAGQDTGFVVQFGRPDQNQTLSKLQLHMPPGLIGRLADFPLCPNAQANAGTCSDDSLVGGVTVSAGSGPAPLNVPGKVFITEPRGADSIAGLSIVVPAIAGPYNLGTPVVRADIHVNPDTSLTVTSDPLPTILSGVQLRIKQVIVNLSRQGFMFNPTDCSPMKIEGTLTSDIGTDAAVASPFGVHGCADLPFKPQMTLGTVKPSKDGAPTSLNVDMKQSPGEANMRVVDLTLPKQIGSKLDGALQHACSETDFANDACASNSQVGTASATTPVLPQPLSGPVYFLAKPGGGLPRLAIRLRGAITLDVIGDVTLNKAGRIVTEFPAIPDVPISDFQLSLAGGPNAALTAAGLCNGKLTAAFHSIAHSGRQYNATIPLSVKGCTTTKKSKKA